MAIVSQTVKYSDDQIYALLHPLLRNWFKQKFGSFTEPQRYAFESIHKGENTLVSAPTGTGKTLSAFTAVLNELISLSDSSVLEDRVYCVYISPLRALNNDIQRNLLEPLEEIQSAAGKPLPIRTAIRTGDTTTSERAKMLKKAPHILITTPESMAILLNSPKFIELLKGVQWLIIDEVHALAENKRGVHLSITMERLQEKSPNMTRIGLSATVSPLEEMASFIVGMKNEKEARDCKVVDVQFIKELDLKVLSPLPDLIDTTAEKTSEALYNTLHDLIQQHRTTLVFTNTRAATERVVHKLKDMFPGKYEGFIGAHHSSLSREHRLITEQNLKDGKLKVVVSSTSLELGIDIGYIDLVILLGSPKSVARCLQRVGRSGHKLHSQIKGRIIVLDRDDLVECAVLAKCAIERKLDKVFAPTNALDVLAQHIYGIAIEEKRNVDDVFKLVKHSYCYRSLTRSDFDEVIRYLSGEYASLEQRSVYAKIWFDPNSKEIGKRGKMARVIYMTNIGTIPDEARVKVKLGEFQIGTIDEGFLERLKKGDVFVLGGQSYVFKYAIGMTAVVSAADKRPPTVPSWVSEMLPLSFDLSLEIQKFRRLMNDQFRAKKSKKQSIDFVHDYLYVDKNAANAIYEYFREQYAFSKIPHDQQLVVELFNSNGLRHALFLSLYGRRVNDVLSRCFGYALGKLLHQDIQIELNDNGFVLSASGKLPIQQAIGLVDAKELRKIAEKSIADSEVLRRRFRHCAARSLMILRNYKGRQKSVGRQQMSSRLLFSAVQRISNDFSILREARREVLEDLMDIQSAKKVVQWIDEKKLELVFKEVEFPSPFGFNLYTQGFADSVKIEGKIAFIKRMHEQVLQRIGDSKKTKVDSKELMDLTTPVSKPKTEKERKLLDLKLLAWNLPHVPNDAKEELIALIDGKGELSPRFLEGIKKYEKEIKKTWPKEIQQLVFEKTTPPKKKVSRKK